MKRLIALCLLAAFALGTEAVAPPKARCAYCLWTEPCYDNVICGQGCVCLKRGLDISGYCYSYQ